MPKRILNKRYLNYLLISCKIKINIHRFNIETSSSCQHPQWKGISIQFPFINLSRKRKKNWGGRKRPHISKAAYFATGSCQNGCSACVRDRTIWWETFSNRVVEKKISGPSWKKLCNLWIEAYFCAVSSL